ncbi:MAG: hypothetical protein IPK69_05415 [Phycisphaerales bacterium]|nr:MAG: hypothetical protein IPK69_05415 [Phycisphaerales bacterium]
MTRCTSAAALVALAGLSGLASATITGFSYSASLWGASDADLGIAGHTIEDFEDTTLAPGFRVAITSSIGNLAPTSTLPSLMSAAADPFGTAFVDSNWDGSRVLLNTFDNQSKYYYTAGNWGNLTMYFDTPVNSIGFSVQQMQRTATNRIIINGIDRGDMLNFLGLSATGLRNGYARIFSFDETIQSVTLTSTYGDGWTVDHVAYGVIPAPASAMVGVLGLGMLGRRRR